MLTRVVVRNFASLRNVEVGLGRINVLVGANASGKSNFVRALCFLRELIVNASLEEATRSIGYSKPVETVFNQDPKLDVTIRVEAVIDGELYRYEIKALPGHNSVFSERLTAKDSVLLQSVVGAGGFFLSSDNAKEQVPAPPSILRWVVEKADCHPLIRKFYEYVSKWSFYSFNPEAIRSYASVESSTKLDREGRNLPQVLHTLLTTNRRVFETIESQIRSCVPEIEEIVLPVVSGPRVYIAVREKGFEKPFSFQQISDGTLRLLAFITALSLEPTLVAFEEPENCVHPYLLETLVDLARKSGRQVIISTHSPYLLDHVKPEEVLLVSKTRGETRIKKLTDTREIDAVKKFLENGGTLGEAWYSGVMQHEEDTSAS